MRAASCSGSGAIIDELSIRELPTAENRVGQLNYWEIAFLCFEMVAVRRKALIQPDLFLSGVSLPPLIKGKSSSEMILFEVSRVAFKSLALS